MTWSKIANGDGCILRMIIKERGINTERKHDVLAQRFRFHHSVPKHRVISDEEVTELDWNLTHSCDVFTKEKVIENGQEQTIVTEESYTGSSSTQFAPNSQVISDSTDLILLEWYSSLSNENSFLESYSIIDSLNLNFNLLFEDIPNQTIKLSLNKDKIGDLWEFSGRFSTTLNYSDIQKEISCELTLQDN